MPQIAYYVVMVDAFATRIHQKTLIIILAIIYINETKNIRDKKRH